MEARAAQLGLFLDDREVWLPSGRWPAVLANRIDIYEQAQNALKRASRRAA